MTGHYAADDAEICAGWLVGSFRCIYGTVIIADPACLRDCKELNRLCLLGPVYCNTACW